MGKHVSLKDSRDYVYGSEELHNKKKLFGKKQKTKRSKSVTEKEEEKYRKSKSSTKVRYTTPKYYHNTSDDSDDEPILTKSKRSFMDRCLVGKVPRRPGGKPGLGGGVAFFMKKEAEYFQPEEIATASSSKKIKKSVLKKLKRKQSY